MRGFILMQRIVRRENGIRRLLIISLDRKWIDLILVTAGHRCRWETKNLRIRRPEVFAIPRMINIRKENWIRVLSIIIKILTLIVQLTEAWILQECPIAGFPHQIDFTMGAFRIKWQRKEWMSSWKIRRIIPRAQRIFSNLRSMIFQEGLPPRRKSTWVRIQRLKTGFRIMGKPWNLRNSKSKVSKSKLKRGNALSNPN